MVWRYTGKARLDNLTFSLEIYTKSDTWGRFSLFLKFTLNVLNSGEVLSIYTLGSDFRYEDPSSSCLSSLLILITKTVKSASAWGKSVQKGDCVILESTCMYTWSLPLVCTYRICLQEACCFIHTKKHLKRKVWGQRTGCSVPSEMRKLTLIFLETQGTPFFLNTSNGHNLMYSSKWPWVCAAIIEVLYSGWLGHDLLENMISTFAHKL